MKTVVITGSTRGIGLGLARAFLEEGCSVVLSGRDAGRVEQVRAELGGEHGEGRILGVVCDVTDCGAVQRLWNESVARFGSVDIWINNAGISHPQVEAWEQPIDRTKAIVDTNVLGTIYGARVAIAGMLSQGHGAIYNLEGLGSAGRHVPGTSLYATTKAAVRYFTDALILETKGTPLVVGAIRPGMVMTDLVLDGLDRESPDWPRAKRIFNILADRVETVAPWIARRVLENDRTGVRIDWLTRRRAFARFLLAPFRRRNVFD
jgi:NAD(P)-dependent dehydrogenase (short-subunit alcohol dehydrogenase family)